MLHDLITYQIGDEPQNPLKGALCNVRIETPFKWAEGYDLSITHLATLGLVLFVILLQQILQYGLLEMHRVVYRCCRYDPLQPLLIHLG